MGSMRQPLSPFGILGPDGRRQPVRAVVHQPDGLVVAVYRHDSNDWPETLFHHEAHAMVDTHQPRRLEEVSRPAHSMSPRQYPRASVHGLLYLEFEKVQSFALSQRPYCSAILFRVAHPVFLHLGDIGIDEPGEQRALDIY